MNLDKSTKRIAKRVKKGFQGYPKITLTYIGDTPNCANAVIMAYVEEEGSPPQEQQFNSTGDAREDETIQTTLLKVIERTDAKTVVANESVVTH